VAQFEGVGSVAQLHRKGMNGTDYEKNRRVATKSTKAAEKNLLNFAPSAPFVATSSEKQPLRRGASPPWKKCAEV
jgi:D-aminopeptidase